MYEYLVKEKPIYKAENKIQKKQERSMGAAAYGTMGWRGSVFGVVQRYKVPKGLEEHKQDLNVVEKEIKDFFIEDILSKRSKVPPKRSKVPPKRSIAPSRPSLVPMVAYSRRIIVPKSQEPLETVILGADNWAKETRNAALRKYNELHIVLKYSKNNKKLYQLGINTSDEPDVLYINETNKVKKDLAEEIKKDVMPVRNNTQNLTGEKTIINNNKIKLTIKDINDKKESMKSPVGILLMSNDHKSKAFKDTYIEVKTVSGKADQIRTNILNANEQLNNRMLNYVGTGIIEIFITDDTWSLFLNEKGNFNSLETTTLKDMSINFNCTRKVVLHTPDGEMIYNIESLNPIIKEVKKPKTKAVAKPSKAVAKSSKQVAKPSISAKIKQQAKVNAKQIYLIRRKELQEKLKKLNPKQKQYHNIQKKILDLQKLINKHKNK